MLTCKVGNILINCFDGKYNKYTLKQWDEEKRLICPDCGKLYEYCHGDVVSPYFRHKEKSKECEDIFHEPETEEHIKGKQILYNWLLTLQKNGVLSNVKLESYIPETRQRPDLYFEMNNERYVIEFQCSPIATEYLNRHELYRLAGINDIWIMGTEKYNLHFKRDNSIWHDKRLKAIEKYNNFYLRVKNSNIVFNSDIIKTYLPYNKIKIDLYNFLSYKIYSFEIVNSTICLEKSVINEIINKDIEIYNNEIKLQNIEAKCDTFLDKIFKEFEDKYFTEFNTMSFNFGFKCNKHYYKLSNIKNYPIIDFCSIKYINNEPVESFIFNINLDTDNTDKIIQYLKLDLKETIDFNIEKHNLIIEYEEKEKNELSRLKQELSKFKPIYLLFAEDNYKIDNNVRFKMVHDYPENIKKLAILLLKELKFIKSKGADKYVLMIPRKKIRESNSFLYPYYKVRNYKSDVENDFSELGLEYLKYNDLWR